MGTASLAMGEKRGGRNGNSATATDHRGLAVYMRGAKVSSRLTCLLANSSVTPPCEFGGGYTIHLFLFEIVRIND